MPAGYTDGYGTGAGYTDGYGSGAGYPPDAGYPPAPGMFILLCLVLRSVPRAKKGWFWGFMAF